MKKTERLRDDMDMEITKLATKVEVAELRARIDIFSDLEHMHYLQNVLLPKVQGFSDKLNEFLASNEEIKEVVRIFDKSISTKANKADVELFKKECESMYVNKANWLYQKAECDLVISNMISSGEELNRRFSEFRAEE